MTKRLLALILAGTLIFALAACSSETSDAPNSEEQGTEEQTADNPETPDGDPQPVEIWLTRHGETLFNERDLVQGWVDAPLTEEGEAFTAYVGAGLHSEGVIFNAVYSSDLTRCLHTAAILVEQLGTDLEVQPDARFREMNFGVFEGESRASFREAHPEIYEFDTFAGAEGGESWDDLEARVIPALLEIGEKHSTQGGNIMVVTHGMVVLEVIHYLDSDFVITPDVMPNNSITVIVYENGELTLKSMPDTTYADIGMQAAGVIAEEQEVADAAADAEPEAEAPEAAGDDEPAEAGEPEATEPERDTQETEPEGEPDTTDDAEDTAA